MFSSVLNREYGGVSSRSLHESCTGSLHYLQRLKLQKKLNVHGGCVNTICWNDSGTLLLSGSDDQHLAISNPFDGKVLVKFRSGHRSNIFSAKFLPGSYDREVVSCSGSGEIFYTNIDREDTYGTHRFDCHFGTAYKLVVVPNEASTFLSCGYDGTIRFFDLRIKTSCSAPNCEENILIHLRNPVSAMAVDPVLPYQLAVGSADGMVRIYDRRKLKTREDGGSSSGLLCQFVAPSVASQKSHFRITSLAYRPSSHDVLVNYSSENIYLFNSYLPDNVQTFSTAVNSGETSRPADNNLRDASCAGPSRETSDGGSVNAGAVGGVSTTKNLMEDESTFKPIKRLRMRGDWSDTGPDARPESEDTAPTNMLMQRMSDLLTHMLNNRSGSGRPEEQEGREQGHQEQAVDRDSNSGPVSRDEDTLRQEEEHHSQVAAALIQSVVSSAVQSQARGRGMQLQSAHQSISSEDLVSPALSSQDLDQREVSVEDRDDNLFQGEATQQQSGREVETNTVGCLVQCDEASERQTMAAEVSLQQKVCTERCHEDSRPSSSLSESVNSTEKSIVQVDCCSECQPEMDSNHTYDRQLISEAQNQDKEFYKFPVNSHQVDFSLSACDTPDNSCDDKKSSKKESSAIKVLDMKVEACVEDVNICSVSKTSVTGEHSAKQKAEMEAFSGSCERNVEESCDKVNKKVAFDNTGCMKISGANECDVKSSSQDSVSGRISASCSIEIPAATSNAEMRTLNRVPSEGEKGVISDETKLNSFEEKNQHENSECFRKGQDKELALEGSSKRGEELQCTSGITREIFCDPISLQGQDMPEKVELLAQVSDESSSCSPLSGLSSFSMASFPPTNSISSENTIAVAEIDSTLWESRGSQCTLDGISNIDSSFSSFGCASIGLKSHVSVEEVLTQGNITDTHGNRPPEHIDPVANNGTCSTKAVCISELSNKNEENLASQNTSIKDKSTKSVSVPEQVLTTEAMTQGPVLPLRERETESGIGLFVSDESDITESEKEIPSSCSIFEKEYASQVEDTCSAQKQDQIKTGACSKCYSLTGGPADSEVHGRDDNMKTSEVVQKSAGSLGSESQSKTPSFLVTETCLMEEYESQGFGERNKDSVVREELASKKSKGKGKGKSSARVTGKSGAQKAPECSVYNSGKMQFSTDQRDVSCSSAHNYTSSTKALTNGSGKDTSTSYPSGSSEARPHGSGAARQRRKGYSLPPTGNFQLYDDDNDSEEERRNAQEKKRMHKAAEKLQEVFREKRRVREASRLLQSQPRVLMKFSGHRNCRTMIKEANFYGDDFVISGSDCGRILAWDRLTGKLVAYFDADRHVVNCVQPNPFFPVLASSGIDYDIKIWMPSNEEAHFSQEEAEMIIHRNELMLEETRDTLTVPATFMLRILASLSQMRSGQGSGNRHSNQEREGAE